jgi:molybdopterin synthase catalytic subunit
MTIAIAISDGPLAPLPHTSTEPHAGAVVIFEGIVRGLEDGRPLRALDYEAYLPMAEAALRELASEAASTHGLLAVHVQHSHGVVPVGGCSFRLVIQAPHRKEALAAMDEFIDRMKRDAPIWKRPIWA